MSWKKITLKEINYICMIRGDVPQGCCDTEILKDIINKFDIVDYSALDKGCPIMYALSYGDFRADYKNPRNGKEFYRKYGYENPKIFDDIMIMDHVYAFRDSNKKMYILSNPYSSREEIIQRMKDLPVKSDKYGDYKKLKYEILAQSYYSKKTTGIIFYGETK